MSTPDSVAEKKELMTLDARKITDSEIVASDTKAGIWQDFLICYSTPFGNANISNIKGLFQVKYFNSYRI